MRTLMRLPRRLVLLVAVLSLCMPSLASAQSARVQWDTPDAPVAAQANNYTLKVDAATPAAVTVTCAALTGTPGLLSRCSTVLPSLAVGPHTLVVTASNAGGSTSSDPVALSPPGKPVNVIVITIIVQ